MKLFLDYKFKMLFPFRWQSYTTVRIRVQVSTSRAGRRSQNGASGSGPGASDCRQGESSGYESVMRDSECSSFGSSQDSGLDDEVNPAVTTKGCPSKG